MGRVHTNTRNECRPELALDTRRTHLTRDGEVSGTAGQADLALELLCGGKVVDGEPESARLDWLGEGVVHRGKDEDLALGAVGVGAVGVGVVSGDLLAVAAVARADGLAVGRLRGGEGAAAVHIGLGEAAALELSKEILLVARPNPERVDDLHLALRGDPGEEEALGVHRPLPQLCAFSADGRMDGTRG